MRVSLLTVMAIAALGTFSAWGDGGSILDGIGCYDSISQFISLVGQDNPAVKIRFGLSGSGSYDTKLHPSEELIFQSEAGSDRDTFIFVTPPKSGVARKTYVYSAIQPFVDVSKCPVPPKGEASHISFALQTIGKRTVRLFCRATSDSKTYGVCPGDALPNGESECIAAVNKAQPLPSFSSLASPPKTLDGVSVLKHVANWARRFVKDFQMPQEYKGAADALAEAKRQVQIRCGVIEPSASTFLESPSALNPAKGVDLPL